ncbi:excisionase family DNA-binding protein [Frigoribacterium sp. UYMn621]|uniref:excisionase family DNA-binding protein n=1 Tax=Frigoribacterium sp. UYMn621 TaxID=3156343 RepID=UPI0033962F6B
MRALGHRLGGGVLVSRFVVGEDGQIGASSEVWGWVSARVSKLTRQDARLNGSFSPLLLELVDATGRAAHCAEGVLVVPSPEPVGVPVATIEVTPDEAAKRMGCSSEYVRRLARNGRLEARRVGRSWLIEASQIDRPAPRRTT